MTDVTKFDPHKEEDEGYQAAETGQGVNANPYPRGTIRYEHWRHGWHVKRDEIRNDENEGYQAAASGQTRSQNPYPRGTIRFEQWRHGWQLKNNETQRARRLGR